MYYRLAIQSKTSPEWYWKSTVLSSLGAVLQLLRLYRALPPDRLLVCSAPSRERLNDMLRRANDGLESGAVTAAQFLQERLLHPPVGTQSTSSWGRQEQQETTSVAVATPPLVTGGGPATMASDAAAGDALEQRRRTMEEGADGDHDTPYAFALPQSLPQALAWMRLLARVQRGELQP
jgi:hypothetical protein